MINAIIKQTRRTIVFVIGATILAFGIILLFTPGPAVIVIPLGLFILATEFVWARMLLHRIKEKAIQTHKK